MKTYRIKSVIAAFVALAASLVATGATGAWADLTGPKPPKTIAQGK